MEVCDKKNMKPNCCYGGPTVPPISEGQVSISGLEKETVSQKDYGDAAISNTTVDARIQYGNLAMAACSNFAFKIAAKLLHLKTWLLLAVYRNSSSLDPTILLQTPFDVQFSHNMCIADNRQTHGRPKTGHGFCET